MLRFKMTLRNSRVPFITIVSICGLVLVIGAVARKSLLTRSKPPQIQNKTHSFAITQTKRREGDVELSFRNGYDRHITAYAVSVNGTITLVDFLYSEFEDHSGIAPQTVYTNTFSFAQPVNPTIAALERLDINVLAVVLDDKSSDGDPRPAFGILNARLASKMRLAPVVRLLNKALDSPGDIDDTTFEELKARISSLPTDSQSSSEKELVLRRLDEFDRLSRRERIARLKEIYESLIARL